MTPTKTRPEWACVQWGNEHEWQECPQCLDAYDRLIQSAQDDLDDIYDDRLIGG